MSEYDLTLISSGDGWVGTFVHALRTIIEDILDDHDGWTVELTTDDEVISGRMVAFDTQDYTVTIEDWPYRIDINDVLKFRA